MMNKARVSTVMKMAVPRNASAIERKELVKRAGANRLRKATHAVMVYVMDMDVLIVTIWPNFEKGWMRVCVSGMAATMVVRALLAIETPMCDTATRLRH